MRPKNGDLTKTPKIKKTGAEDTKVNSSTVQTGLLPREAEWNISEKNFAALPKIFDRHLQKETFQVGSKYPRTVYLIYLEGTTAPDLITEFSKRLESLQTGWVANINHLTRLITNRAYWLFPEFQITSSLNNATSALAKGKMLLMLADETEAMIAPADFLSFFQNPGDSPGEWFSPGVILRLSAFALAIFLPAFYIAMVSFQYYAVSVKLFLLLAQVRTKVPFPPVIDVLFLITLLETIREGAIRLSTPPGKLISAIGGVLLAIGLGASGYVSPGSAIFCSSAFLVSLVFPIEDLLYPTRTIMLASIIMTAIFGVLGMVITASLAVSYLVGLNTSDRQYIQPAIGLKRSQQI